MPSKEIVIKNSKITLCGSNSQITKTENLIVALDLIGDERIDRLAIQKALDDSTGNARVLYDGNTVYPLKSLLKELLRMRKTGSILKMSNKMYEFMSLNFDIAHYNKQGYIYTYNGCFNEMYNATKHQMKTTPMWQSDVRNILLQAHLI